MTSTKVEPWPFPEPQPWWWGECSQTARRFYLWARATGESIAEKSGQNERARIDALCSSKEARTLRLVVSDPKGFGCPNLLHFALALKDLDCQVRIHDGAVPAYIVDGTVTRPGIKGIRDALLGDPVLPGGEITFEVVGPDAEAALPIIEETFARGLENHLPKLREYQRMQEEKRQAKR